MSPKNKLMKSLLLVLVAVCFANSLQAQNFAPVGATWHYTQNIYSNFTEKQFFKIESIQDSVFAGKNCTLLEKNEEFYCEERPLQVLVYEEDSVVYFWDEGFNEFQVLYDLKKNVSEFWYVKVKASDQSTDTITVTVTGTYQRTINAMSLEGLDINYFANYRSLGTTFSWDSKILERIGDTTFLFNFHPEQVMYCDDNFSGGLRCYEDDVIGFYSNNSAPACEYQNVGLEDEELTGVFSIYPNPSNGEFKIINTDLLELKYFLYNSAGQKIAEGESNTKEFQFDRKIESGIYLLNVYHNSGQLTRKIVVE